jgi:hypothetical protein
MSEKVETEHRGQQQRWDGASQWAGSSERKRLSREQEALCMEASATRRRPKFQTAHGGRKCSHGRRSGSSGRRLEQATSWERRSAGENHERARRIGDLTDMPTDLLQRGTAQAHAGGALQGGWAAAGRGILQTGMSSSPGRVGALVVEGAGGIGNPLAGFPYRDLTVGGLLLVWSGWIHPTRRRAAHLASERWRAVATRRILDHRCQGAGCYP